MKIIVTGSNGFLGRHLSLSLAGKGFEVHALSRGESRFSPVKNICYHSLELTDVRTVTQIIRDLMPDAIVHTAALSKPDECNADSEKCLAYNVEATRYLADAAKNTNSHFVYISTDFIFGEDGPHSEDDEPGPLNFYGESKLRAEQLLQQSVLDHCIVRPVFIYGKCLEGMRPSFLHWVKNNLEQGKAIKVVTDQQRTPTYVGDLCAGITQIIEHRTRGVYHLAGKNIVSPYEMALTVAKTLGLNSALIQPVTSDTFPEPVRRAKRSGLKISKAIRELGYAPIDFEEGVRLSFL